MPRKFWAKKRCWGPPVETPEWKMGSRQAAHPSPGSARAQPWGPIFLPRHPSTSFPGSHQGSSSSGQTTPIMAGPLCLLGGRDANVQRAPEPGLHKQVSPRLTEVREGG